MAAQWPIFAIIRTITIIIFNLLTNSAYARYNNNYYSSFYQRPNYSRFSLKYSFIVRELFLFVFDFAPKLYDMKPDADDRSAYGRWSGALFTKIARKYFLHWKRFCSKMIVVFVEISSWLAINVRCVIHWSYCPIENGTREIVIIKNTIFMFQS